MTKQLLTPNDVLSQGDYAVEQLPIVNDVPAGSTVSSSLRIDLKDKNYVVLAPTASPTDEGELTFWAKLNLDNNIGDFTQNRLSFTISVKADELIGAGKHSIAITRLPEQYETSSVFPYGTAVITAGNTNVDTLSWLDFIEPLSGPSLGWNKYRLIYGSWSTVGTRYRLERHNGSSWQLMFDILDKTANDANSPGYLLFGALNQQSTSPAVSEVLYHDINHVATSKRFPDHVLESTGEFVEPFDTDWNTRTIHTLLVTGAGPAEAKSTVTVTGDGIYVESDGSGRQVFRVGQFILQRAKHLYTSSVAYMGSGIVTFSYARGYNNMIYEDLKFDIDSSGNVIFRPWWNHTGATIATIPGWTPATSWQWVRVEFDQQTADQPIWTVYHSNDGITWSQIVQWTEIPNWDIESIDLINNAIVINVQSLPTRLATPEKFGNGNTAKIDNTPYNILGATAYEEAGATKIKVFLEGDLSGIVLPAKLYLTSDQDLLQGTWLTEVHVDPGSYLKDLRYQI